MSKYIPGNQKHLSLEDRKYIERSLNNDSSFKDIARFLCKDPTTISKEVKLIMNFWKPELQMKQSGKLKKNTMQRVYYLMQEKNWVNILIKENKHPIPPKV